MNEISFVEKYQWSLGYFIGTDHPFLHINAFTIIYTWITLCVIALILFIGRYLLSQRDSIGYFITISLVQFFVDLINQTLATFSFNHFTFITTTFCFVLACNIVSIIPWMEEPTTDLNTTLALGLIAFFYTQGASIRAMGVWPYIKSYFSPFFIMLPLNIIGKLATVVSISFRLFGNIYGGSIISSIYFGAIRGKFLLEFIGLISGLNLVMVLFFGIFEGFLQAFVFSMLSLTYLSIALQGEGGH